MNIFELLVVEFVLLLVAALGLFIAGTLSVENVWVAFGVINLALAGVFIVCAVLKNVGKKLKKRKNDG